VNQLIANRKRRPHGLRFVFRDTSLAVAWRGGGN
jgi:hypothetical protein